MKTVKRTATTPAGGLAMPAVGLESEFELWLNGRKKKPEQVFGRPTSFIRAPLVHRQGRSYHLPTGGAVYFDTGVIEVATPVMELARGCMARAGRSLWEGIEFVRRELDAWQVEDGRDAALHGFSTHYSVSYEIPKESQRRGRTVEDLAWLLVHVLPAPIMLLACSRRSTGVGVRPRGNRIEVTVDFTPDPALMIAAGTVIAGVVRTAMEWPTYRLSMLAAHGLPKVRGFDPMKHTSRKGWLAKDRCFPESPFPGGGDTPVLPVGRQRLTVRELARAMVRPFARGIAKLADPFTMKLIRGVLAGKSRGLLDLPERPEAYDHVGRLCAWDDLFTERTLPRAKYERVLLAALSGAALRRGGKTLTPVGMKGWDQVAFRDDGGKRVDVALDELIPELARWERNR